MDTELRFGIDSGVLRVFPDGDAMFEDSEGSEYNFSKEQFDEIIKRRVLLMKEG